MATLKRERIRESVLAIDGLLRMICKSPQTYRSDTTLAAGLVSQGALAGLDYLYLDDGVEKRIVPVSLNALKKNADLLIEHGGYKTLDRRRIAALKAFKQSDEKGAVPSKRTKQGLLAAVDALEELVNSHRRSNFRLLQALSRTIDSLKVVRDCQKPEARNKRTADAIKEILAILSMNETPFDVLPSSKVITSISALKTLSSTPDV